MGDICYSYAVLLCPVNQPKKMNGQINVENK